ncbi:hypothetical protein CWE22_05635 [Pseudidiomarina aestuarii]|uniref:Polysaccharide chain length determinant N-terminal domain-containing protein n=1 Tax=Pseudidiomarina aestuarii TaxID=624146 RepID=A0A7Z6ZUG9_9GAMM|nr:hypothetical protein [Pseudidiomarina aestuarii]RUO41637.1 hypothetical protein CWE22_05635 [Pseudidiomarina aestuarii]
MTDTRNAPIALFQYLNWLRRNWLMAIVYAVFVVGIAVFYTLQIPGLHRATAHTQFQPEAADAGTFDQLSSIVLTGTSESNFPRVNALQHDLALAEYADGAEFNQQIVEHLRTNYSEALERYREQIAAYGDSEENALAYFVRYHFRIYRLQKDHFFIFHWHFFDAEESQRMLNSILSLLDAEMTKRRAARYQFALQQLQNMNLSAAPQAMQELKAQLTALYQSKQAATENGDFQSLFIVLPTEVSAGWVYPSRIKVFLATVAPWLVLGALLINGLLWYRRFRTSRLA